MTSAELSQILDRLLDREGGLVDHPADPGGLTKYGISQRAYPHEDIRNLTPERAKFLYVRDYVFANHLDRLNDSRLVEVMLDWVVNGGPAIRTLQKRLGVSVDGKVGDETIAACNAPDCPPNLAQDLLRDRLLYLVSLTKHPFIKGWVVRLFKLGL